MACPKIKKTTEMEIQVDGESGRRRRRCVVLVPLPFQGHITPMLQLGSILHSRGFSIAVAHTQYNAPNPSTHPEFMFHGLCDGLADHDMSFDRILGGLYIINEKCREPLQEYVKQLMGNGEDIACIIHDNVMFFADAVAAHLNIPNILLCTFSAAYLQAVVTIIPRFDTIFPLQESMVEEAMPGLYPLRFKDSPFPTLNNDVPEPVREFSKTIYDIRSAVACIWNSVHCLEHSSLSKLQKHYKVPFFPIGPFHKSPTSNSPTNLQEEDTSCLAWLDKQPPRSVLYVSTGSLAIVNENELVEIAWGLINSSQPFLWVVRPGLVNGLQSTEQLPEDFEKLVGDRARVVKWAPQKDVLAHPAVGGFMTHCGWNSTLESICAGVPMICKPAFSDQPVIARYLTQIWKVGLELEASSRDVIERTIKKLMVGEEGRELRKRVLDLKEKLEVSILKDGSSYKALDELVEFISTLSNANFRGHYNKATIEHNSYTKQECCET